MFKISCFYNICKLCSALLYKVQINNNTPVFIKHDERYGLYTYYTRGVASVLVFINSTLGTE